MSEIKSVVICSHGKGFSCGVCFPIFVKTPDGTAPDAPVPLSATLAKARVAAKQEQASKAAISMSPMHQLIAKSRSTGKTTRLAVKYVEQALNNQAKWIEIFDHHGTQKSGQDLTNLVGSILDLLNVTYDKKVTSIRVHHIDNIHNKPEETTT